MIIKKRLGMKTAEPLMRAIDSLVMPARDRRNSPALPIPMSRAAARCRRLLSKMTPAMASPINATISPLSEQEPQIGEFQIVLKVRCGNTKADEGKGFRSHQLATQSISQ